ncbi:imelysin family protein [uncultured Tenacibaculum sp.]|uniref:imelysin family protein n=1 Tax=uncultured Tenacibaculum sp. TaxID=174713 RepID=UPI00261A2BA9|nr:imelysin family protein [uncultured Tenacibaculum sp.]
MLHFNKKILIVFSALLIITSSLFISCDDKGVTEDRYQIEYYRTAQLKNIYNNGIVTLTDTFGQEVIQLKESINNLKQTTTLNNLVSAQNNWKDVMKTWKQLELYNLGAIQNSFIHFEINRWETNTSLINDYIDGSDAINETYVESKGSSAKGLSAIEFLLFSSENNQTVLNTLTTALNSQRRLDYLLALSENLEKKETKLKTLWTNSEDTFLNSLQNGISGSQNQLTNAMVSLIEEIVISKLGKPLGEKTGGIISINSLEAYRSGFSLEIINQHLIALEKCYSGNFKQNSIKWGYDNYLDLIGSITLNEKINTAFANCKLKIEAVKNPLREELINNKQNVAELRSSFTNLLVLIKVDLANAIGSTITISDNDGD